MTVAKLYLLLLAFTNCSGVLGLISINEISLNLSFWAWNTLLFAVFLVLPILTIAIDNYIGYTVFAGVSLLRIIVESLGLFPWRVTISLFFMPLYALAVIFCLSLAVEKVSSEVSGEILRLTWSQF